MENAVKVPKGTVRALKDFFSNLDAETVQRLGADVVDGYKQRLERFEQNYQAGGAEAARDAGIEFGSLLVDGVALISGVGGAAKLGASLGVKVLEKGGALLTRAAELGVSSLEDLGTAYGEAARLGEEAKAATSGISSDGRRISVIGHNPEYVDAAEVLNGNRFVIPERIASNMSDADVWAANQKFLDRAIGRGDVLFWPVTAYDLVLL